MTRFLILLIMTGCANEKQQAPEQAPSAVPDPCRDRAILLATTSGSPDEMICWHRLHRIRAQVVTQASKEEAAALVLCECDRDAGVD